MEVKRARPTAWNRLQHLTHTNARTHVHFSCFTFIRRCNIAHSLFNTFKNSKISKPQPITEYKNYAALFTSISTYERDPAGNNHLQEFVFTLPKSNWPDNKIKWKIEIFEPSDSPFNHKVRINLGPNAIPDVFFFCLFFFYVGFARIKQICK